MISRVPRKMLMLGMICAVSLAAAVTVASAHTTPAAKGKTVLVTLHDYMFNPSTVTIHVGDTVEWKWEDAPSGMHNITPLKKKGGLLFKGTGIHTRGTYSVKFTKAGTYSYECSIHPLTMQAKIIVKK